MADPLTKFRALETKLVAAIAKRVAAFIARGETIHRIGVRRWGDDDGYFAFVVSVDPVLNGAEQDYESRDSPDAQLWRLKTDGPAALKKIFDALAAEHEDLDPDDLPGRTMTEPHALFTSMLDSLATKLATRAKVRVELLDTEAVPIEDDERAALRDWLAAR